MEDELKTVGEVASTPDLDSGLVNPLLREQTAQAAQMRDALLTCKTDDTSSAKVALQKIAVLQVYHQVARIIRYTEVMDRLEDKLYDSIDANLSQMDEFDPATMILLTKIQGDLQKSMVLSQDLLKPYMNIDLDAIAPQMKDIGDDSAFGATILPRESRNAIRNGAQALLTELKKTENQSEELAAENLSDSEETDDGNTTADTQ